MDHMDQELRLAVLIDADNAPRTALREIMAEVAVYGTPTIKRIYGDWTTPNMASWKALLLEHAITPFQQYSYTTGKNATDSAMIIDAMDILYSGNVRRLCAGQQRQRLHPPGHPAARGGDEGDTAWGRKRPLSPSSWPATSLCISSR